jgi:hypothetical protein
MKASVSVISNVIDVKDPLNDDGTPKVLIWQYSWKLFQEIRSYFRDADYGDLTHPLNGRNFKISASVVSSQGQRQWTRYDLQVGAKPTELETPEALDHLYDLDSTFPVKIYSYEEQKMIWDGTWDPRSGRTALPASAASTAPKLESKNTEEEFADTPSPKAAPKEDDLDEFEAASEDDDWGDLTTSGDSEKQNAMQQKLAALKKAAKK